MVKQDFWKDRKVFLTGHTGFKGSWISLWLHQMGAIVTGYALKPEPLSLFELTGISRILEKSIIADIRDLAKLKQAMIDCKPEIVIHMAAQPLVQESYIDPLTTYTTNVIGTVNLMEAIRETGSVKTVLNITTDKCYENNEWIWGYRENEPMGGHDPYSSSKACAELVSTAYRKSFLQSAGIGSATARAGNVIGGGDWAKNRIVPDTMRAFISGETLLIRNQSSIRPWQHVLEPLAGYLMLCQSLFEKPLEFQGPWNFGPRAEDAQPVSVLVNIMADNWGNTTSWKTDDKDHPHEAHYLKLDCSKANHYLQWKPIWTLNRALSETVQWYKAWHEKNDMFEYSLRQIRKYQSEQAGNE